MAPLPKRKYAKARQGKRRSHLGLETPPLDYCPQCRNIKRAHHVCPACGKYNGRDVVEIKSSGKKE